MTFIRYRSLRRYKYQLCETYRVYVGIKLAEAIESPGGWLKLFKDGYLEIRKGYCWDGPSGPTIDSPNFMRPSLAHDALYQLMRLRLLDVKWRKHADELLREHCLEDGMSRFRSRYVYWAVRRFGSFSTDPKPEPAIVRAP
jgi:hypothetical protein